jgi:predicted lysophospholipase L1 biosynthesis ABC-type transport system permease subunit
MLEELRALPGVRDAAFTSTLPLDGQGLGNPIEVRGVPAGSADATPVVRARRVSANYFTTLNIRVIAGGFVNTNGLPNGPHPVVVNQALVARYFGLTNPLGREIRPLGGGNEEWLAITGVVANTVTYDLRETSPVPQMFVSLTDSARANLPAPQDGVIVLQTANDPTSVIASVRQRLASLDPNVAMARPERLTDVVERSRAPMLFAMILAVLAATVALTLAVVGTYSVIAYGVAQRRAEIGVRLALGATPRAVTSMIIRDSGRTIVAGVVLGALGGLASARLLSSFVFDVAPADAWTHAGGALGLLVVALVACWIPARRAGRLDPVTVLGRG